MLISTTHTVQIWTLGWKNYINRKNIFWNSLSHSEKTKAWQLLCDRDRERFIITKGLLRTLIRYLTNDLSRHYEFEHSVFGKPKLPGNPLCFNISHAGDWVAYAFCKKQAVGIDIEKTREILNINRLVDRYFSFEECKLFHKLNLHHKKQFFLEGWVQKEAIAKLLGMGLRLPLKDIVVNDTCIVQRPKKIDLPILGKPNVSLYLIQISSVLYGALAMYSSLDHLTISQHTDQDFCQLVLIDNER